MTKSPRDVDQHNMFIIIIILIIFFTIFVSMIHSIFTFRKCDNIITYVYQSLTLRAIRYYMDQVKLCCVLLFLYAFLFRL